MTKGKLKHDYAPSGGMSASRKLLYDYDEEMANRPCGNPYLSIYLGRPFTQKDLLEYGEQVQNGTVKREKCSEDPDFDLPWLEWCLCFLLLIESPFFDRNGRRLSKPKLQLVKCSAWDPEGKQNMRDYYLNNTGINVIILHKPPAYDYYKEKKKEQKETHKKLSEKMENSFLKRDNQKIKTQLTNQEKFLARKMRENGGKEDVPKKSNN